MKMKKLAAVALAVVMSVSMLAGCGSSNDKKSAESSTSANGTATVKTAKDGVLTMATNATFPPYESYEGNDIVGIDADIAKAIADKLGLKLEIQDMEFNSIITAVQSGKADLGLAYDGDADRLIAVDEKGHEVDGDHIMILGAVYLKKQNKLANDTLVVTTMSNIGLHAAAKEYGIDLAITDVGDRYVIEEMKKSGHNLGGEQSGHMIFLDYNTTGDGTLSSLIVSKIVKEEGKTLSEQSALMTTYPQVLINVEVRNEVKNKFMENDEIRAEIERLEKLMNGTGRVLIRPSGTQPLVRVMLEGKDEGQIRELAQGLADLIKEKLA